MRVDTVVRDSLEHVVYFTIMINNTSIHVDSLIGKFAWEQATPSRMMVVRSQDNTLGIVIRAIELFDVRDGTRSSVLRSLCRG